MRLLPGAGITLDSDKSYSANATTTTALGAQA